MLNSTIFEKEVLSTPEQPPFRDFSFPKPLDTGNRSWRTSASADASASTSPRMGHMFLDDGKNLDEYTYEKRNSLTSDLDEGTSASPPPLTPTRSRLRHRKSNAISVSSPEELYSPQTPKSDVQAQFLGRPDILASPTVGPIQYNHQLSPKDTIHNTNEQIRRNTVGVFGSLSEFAAKNHIDLKGRVFVDTNDYDTPLIDLGQVYRNQWKKQKQKNYNPKAYSIIDTLFYLFISPANVFLFRNDFYFLLFVDLFHTPLSTPAVQ